MGRMMPPPPDGATWVCGQCPDPLKGDYPKILQVLWGKIPMEMNYERCMF